MKPKIAERANEIYESRAHEDGGDVQDWTKAEGEVRNAEAKVEPKPDVKAAVKPEAKADQPQPATDANKPQPEVKVDEKAPDAEPKTQSEVTPQLVKRVHALYEELGREEIQAVEKQEKSELHNK